MSLPDWREIFSAGKEVKSQEKRSLFQGFADVARRKKIRQSGSVNKLVVP
ncbi:hypothetical protein SAMN04490178_11748 [Propionispora vibrioides]|uniref:Uncharacterized protein n=1 Tax=Propionispora vibrioides TaxID=112903 RepID=A0A1H8WQU3_9FIRM|nr:hypothetical protein SAMN04490178_11748 [Propionispora vibrioides]